MSMSTLTPAERVLRRLERERREESDARRAVWGFLWILFVFKFVTIGIIWYVAAGSGESLSMIAATTWYWLIIPIAALSGPLLYRWRMIQMRKRRQRLLAAEFAVEPTIVMLPEGTRDDVPPGGAGPG
jgi:Flp pilus assembly protein TadB